MDLRHRGAGCAGPGASYTFYVGVRNGGVWKTVNNGTTFEPVFDAQSTTTIGAIAVAPSDQNIVWVGTGDTYQTRTSYAGDGVYKSPDAGKTWANMGLRDSHHIARILVHPVNPNRVYVAAMGHLYSANAERGLFVTDDGGKTWRKSLYVNDKTGVIDVVMNRKNPDILYAVTYELKRVPWDLDVGARAARLEDGQMAGRHGRSWPAACRPAASAASASTCSRPTRTFSTPSWRTRTSARHPREAERDKDRPKPFEHVIGNQVYRSNDAGRNWKQTHDHSISPGNKAPYSST